MLSTIQRARWAAAIRAMLRAASGRDPSRAEVDGRVAAYLNAASARPLAGQSPTSGPLFSAADYSPRSDQDPLGGPDGRDLSRAWAAVREDLDCVGEGIGESERRMAQSLSQLRAQARSLTDDLEALLLSASALESQMQAPFYGNAAGRGQTRWSQSAATGLVYPQTTAVLLGGLGSLPSLGAGQDTAGGTLLTVTALSSTDPAVMRTAQGRAWAENPFASSPAAWLLTGPQTVTLSFSAPPSLLEIAVGPGTSLTAVTAAGVPVPFQTLSSGGSVWAVLSGPRPEMSLTFTGTADSSGALTGSVLGLKAHALSLDASAALVWGPFTSLSGAAGDPPYAVCLESTSQVTPPGSRVEWRISTVSPDGPWASVTPGTPIVLRSNGRQELDLLSPSPDPLTLGYFSFPVANAGSMQGAALSAGLGQAKVDAFAYDWGQERDVLHSPTPSDWDSPKGVVRTVAMGAGPTYTGGVSDQPTLTQRLTAGSCLASYGDSLGRSLTAVVVTSTDPSNPHVLQPGYNYRFTWGLYAAGPASLRDVPVGLLNPDGATPGGPGYPYAVLVNGVPVCRSGSYFTDYTELSPPPAGYGSLASQYAPLSGGGSGNPSTPAGASWPPFCGRMSVVLRPGWNQISVLLYVPVPQDGDPDYLGRSAALVFGPGLFDDPQALYEASGIRTVQGWSAPWTQVSEFDLRNNTPLGFQEAWAWVTDSGGPTGVLLNHDPGASETGFLSLDNVLTGNARTHHLSYLTSADDPSATTPGSDPLSRKVWLAAQMSTSDPTSGPLIGPYTLSIN